MDGAAYATPNPRKHPRHSEQSPFSCSDSEDDHDIAAISRLRNLLEALQTETEAYVKQQTQRMEALRAAINDLETRRVSKRSRLRINRFHGATSLPSPPTTAFRNTSHGFATQTTHTFAAESSLPDRRSARAESVVSSPPDKSPLANRSLGRDKSIAISPRGSSPLTDLSAVMSGEDEPLGLTARQREKQPVRGTPNLDYRKDDSDSDQIAPYRYRLHRMHRLKRRSLDSNETLGHDDASANHSDPTVFGGDIFASRPPIKMEVDNDEAPGVRRSSRKHTNKNKDYDLIRMTREVFGDCDSVPLFREPLEDDTYDPSDGGAASESAIRKTKPGRKRGPKPKYRPTKSGRDAVAGPVVAGPSSMAGSRVADQIKVSKAPLAQRMAYDQPRITHFFSSQRQTSRV